MKTTIRLLLLCGLIYSAIAASDVFQNINIGPGDFGWSDSVHNSDVDKLLKRLEKLDNSDNNRNNWGNDDERNSGFDTDRFRDSDEDARASQIINFG
ncbi:uncharacterized protein LOC108048312 [Drosophila rhopaloa]|uniref:Uncharacterized protein LOC108048312 n=1 Tax=Drosophila rhopaloa TaxID=1041015 RepID=A0A6P4FAJ3_DRORH|nr:uncharacterized protein LOC108048312 [Drosophila rhopaloa]